MLWRWGYTPQQFEQAAQVMSNGDAFYGAKIRSIFRGDYLSAARTRRHQVGIARGFAMLEAALSDGRRFLVDGAFSFADVSVLPRLLKAPINGIIATKAQRRDHVAVVDYFDGLRARPALAPFRRADDAAWASGAGCHVLSFTGFGPSWLDGVPWAVLVAVGNWRHGTACRRLDARDAPSRADAVVMSGELHAIPSTQPPPFGGSLLYVDEACTLCTATRIVLETLRGGDGGSRAPAAAAAVRVESVDVATCANFGRDHLARMPWGEVPCLVVADGAVCYGPANIAEFALEEAMAAAVAKGGGGAKGESAWKQRHAAAAALMPMGDAVARAAARKWAGWARTGWHYQLMPLFWRDVAAPSLRRRFKDRAALEAAIAHSLGGGAEGASRVSVDGLPALEAYANGEGEQEGYGAQAEAELLSRLRSVDAELRVAPPHGQAAGRSFLAGGDAPSMADAFVAPLCAVALLYAQRNPASAKAADELVALHKWLATLRNDHSAFGSCLGRLAEAWAPHGAPSVAGDA